MKRLAFTTLAAMLLACPSASRAEAIINIYNDGLGNVVALGSGTLDTNGLTFLASNLRGASGINASSAVVAVGQSNDATSLYFGISGPASFGSGTASSSSGTGDFFGVSGTGYLTTPDGYISGSSLLGSMTIDGASITSLGLTDGTYVYTWSSDSLVVNISELAPNAVPEPGSMALVLSAAMIGLGARTWSRRRVARG
jgi:hypothetical protein